MESSKNKLIIAAAGIALVAAAAFGTGCGQPRSDSEMDDAPLVVVEGAKDQGLGDAATGDETAPQGEPADAENGADELTATPTDEPTPTATPEPGDPCPLCPDDVDDIVVPATPVVICPLCLEPEFDAELPPLDFAYRYVHQCGDGSMIMAGLNRPAWIWVEYMQGQGEHETDHIFGDEFYVAIPFNVPAHALHTAVFHAVDEQGEHLIEAGPSVVC